MAYASQLKRAEVAKHWANPQTFGTSLLALLIDEFGTEALQWEPETLRLQIKDTYDVTLPQASMDRLMAIITALTTDLFYQSVESFSHIANALSGSGTDFYKWDPVESEEAAWAITEVLMNDPVHPEGDPGDRFSDEVRRYLGVILQSEGIVTPPDILSIADRGSGAQGPDETFSDDPALYSAFYKLSQRKAADIVDYVRGNVHGLVKQLNQLPLQERDQEKWDQFLNRSQPRARQTA